MKAGRHRNDDRVDAGIVDGFGIGAVTLRAAVCPAKRLGPAPVAARIAAHHVGAKRAQMPAVHARNEAATQKGDSNRHGLK
jgi:hypothetical protein